ncbi:MAG TPA: alpha/beta hydrolase [Candidatus Dormibacteraeota bacterium]|nr:alpha/beta hydrolase [Candidatus Dormibacteraeota bacterium]
MIPSYEIAGKGPELVLIPGTFADRRTWSRVVGRLLPRFRCLLLDPRGTNETPDPGTPFTADDLAGDVVAAMDAAKFERAHVVGHSLGASVAVILAARWPDRVRRLVACAPAAAPDAYLNVVFDLWDALAGSKLTDHTVNVGLVLNAFGRAAYENGTVRAIVGEMDRHPIPRDTIRRYVDCDRRLDLSPVMWNVDASTLVIAGAEDTLTGVENARAVAAAVPGARFQVIEGSGHGPHLEAPMAFARIVTSFLNG